MTRWGLFDAYGSITITVERNSGDTPGSGTLIYSLVTELAADALNRIVTFHADDV
jgi:hypothetical protein